MIKPLTIETSRLQIRWLDSGDARFIYQLVTDPDWLYYIGDRGVATIDDARNYIESGPRAMYRRYGFGLYRVALKSGDRPIGICGILKRDSLDDADLGFALLPEFRRQGYAFEAAQAVLQHEFADPAMTSICAILKADNHASKKLLETLGFRYKYKFRAEPDADMLDLYVIDR